MEKLTIARCKTRVATRCYTRLAAVALHDYMLLEFTYTHLHYNFSVSKKTKLFIYRYHPVPSLLLVYNIQCVIHIQQLRSNYVALKILRTLFYFFTFCFW